MAITPFSSDGEKRDAKADSFWTNLTAKMGLKAPLVKQASADTLPIKRLSDGIHTHGATAAHGLTRVSDAVVTRVAAQQGVSAELVSRYERVFRTATAGVGTLDQPGRVKVADRLSRIEADMGAFGDAVQGLGGDQSMVDLCAEINAKAEGIASSCASLRERVDALSFSQADAVESAFLLLSDARGSLVKIGPAGVSPAGAGEAPAKLPHDVGEPQDGDVVGDVPETQWSPEPDEDSKHDHITAGKSPAMLKKAANAAYDELRLAYTKLCLVGSMLASLVTEVNASAAVAPNELPGAEQPGMPPSDQVPGEQKDLEAPAPVATARLRGTMDKFADEQDIPRDGRIGKYDVPEGCVCPECHAPVTEENRDPRHMTPAMECPQCKHRWIVPFKQEASLRTAGTGDPGDTEVGNSIYKDINLCRDCVWFESDWTHETYRDKCKLCTHAKLGGAVDHYWPRAQQMVVWAPKFQEPEPAKKKAFVGTLGLVQTAAKISEAAKEIAFDIVSSVPHTAVDLGTDLMAMFANPVVGRMLPTILFEVVAEIAGLAGVEVAIGPGREKAWGKKSGAIGDGEVSIACDFSTIHLARGERSQIKALREQLRNEKDPAKITSIHDAIEALYSRVDADKTRKEDNRKRRQEKRDSEPAKLPEPVAAEPATASLKGSLCLAQAKRGAL